MAVYTMHKRRDTHEYHLFEGEMTEPGKCSVPVYSICKKMKKQESAQTVFACQSEAYARANAAEIGRPVCGTCISHLYATY